MAIVVAIISFLQNSKFFSLISSCKYAIVDLHQNVNIQITQWLVKQILKQLTFLKLNFLIETFENFPFRIKFSIAYEKLTHVSQKQRKKNHKTTVSKNTPNFNANTLSIKNPKSQNLKNYKGLPAALNIISISKFKKKV